MEIRNFSIIGHIDHGKSTLADRLLEKCGLLGAGHVQQVLDSMELERERGITIKLNTVRLLYRHKSFGGTNSEIILNLVDTPGHVDFGYEVSRSLAAVEGAILLVDASQGVQAQTLTNYYLAKSLDLEIIPAINKIDLPTANVDETSKEVIALTNCKDNDICYISAKTGEGIDQLLDAVVRRISPPALGGDELRALVFDSFYDQYLGVIAYIRVVDGQIKKGTKLSLKATKTSFQCEELGHLQLKRIKTDSLKSGEIGYLATGLKSVEDCRVGDTIVESGSLVRALEGYRHPVPMVYASIYAQGDQERFLKDALDKLKLNDASLTYEPVRSLMLGSGFTIGTLGLLHLDIVRERLEREYNLDIIITPPTVAYRFEENQALEPWVELEVICRSEDFGAVSDLASASRCLFLNATYLSDRLLMKFEAPLAEIIMNFYDRLKSATSGYGSMDYQFKDYRPVDLVTLDLVIGGERIEAFSQKIIRSKVESEARRLVERLKELIPRQNFEVSIQAVIRGADDEGKISSQAKGLGKIIARADIPQLRKDVTAKLYGGDVTRKRKLLEKQKRGKRKMRQIGKVQIPSYVFIELMKK